MNKEEKDQLVQELFDIVQKKKKELEKIKKSNWKTTCMVPYDANINKEYIKNIRTINNERELIELFSFILSKKQSFIEACKILNSDLIFIFNGFSIFDWEHDFKLRFEQISVNSKKQELKEYEARLDKLVSKEQRELMELEELRKKIKND